MKRSGSLWQAVQENAYDDPRTRAAVVVLEAAGVPAYVAPLVVVTAVHRLELWAMRDGDEGLTGHLSAGRLATVAWPEHAVGPKQLGRGERVGNLLRVALAAAPAGGGEAYLGPRCGGCPDSTYVESAGHRTVTCPHEGIQEWTNSRPKIVQDRLAKRARDEHKRLAQQGDAPALPPSSAGQAPGESRATVARPSPLSQPNPTGEREGGIGGPPRAQDRPASFRPPPRIPARRGGDAQPMGAILADLDLQRTTSAPSAAPSSPRGPEGDAAAHSRAPGGGSWDAGAGREGAVRALLGAEPNVREQVSNGRDLTLRRGAYYLFRVGGIVGPERREGWERELGQDPPPGALLWKVDPPRMELLATVLAGKWSTLKNPAAYVRSTLANAWRDVLEGMEGTREQDRHRQALEAAQQATPPAARGTA